MEGDAGTSQLNPTDNNESSEEVVPDAAAAAPETNAEESSEAAVDQVAPNPDSESAAAPRGRSRVGTRRWSVGICAALIVVSAAVGTAGYFALRSHHQSENFARADAAAVQAAKDCVSATQAPDTTAMAASQQKIVECATGDFGAQATLYSGLLVDAYQAANVQVQVSDMRAAAERHNDDGSVDVLVAVRVKVSNSAAQDQEQGYRLRVRMMPDDGKYKISKLDQVTT